MHVDKNELILPLLVADAGVRGAWEHTARAAADLGASVVEVSMPSVPKVSDMFVLFCF